VVGMVYIAFKMPDVTATSGGKSSESSRKYLTFHGAPQWKQDLCHYALEICPMCS
jgi:hypothetical protein